ncbi:hypothetical protein MBANPS3_000472, partial [Mucor bainieri]
SWDPLAERAMFQHEWRFATLEAQRKYYDHLVKKPALAQLIRYICILPRADSSFYARFLELAFTRNLKTIDHDLGAWGNRFDIYILLSGIAQHKPEQYTLEYLMPPPMWEALHVEPFLLFKKTLKCLEFEFVLGGDDDDDANGNGPSTALLNRRNEFESLCTIRLVLGDIEDLMQVETLLRKCTPIEELELDFVVEVAADLWESKEALKEWMMHHVQKDTSVRKLHLDGENINPSIVYYLLHKYPQLTSANIDDCMDIDFPDMHLLVIPLLDALKELPILSLSQWERDFATFISLEDLISNIKSQQNTLRISSGKWSEVSAKKFKSIGITEFTIIDEPDAFEKIITHLSVMSTLDISYGMQPAWKQSGRLSSLYRVLEIVAPHIEKLTIQDMDIQYPPPSYTPPLCNHLSQLEIKGAIVDKQVLSNLSAIAPNLQYLTLNTCLLNTKCHQDYHVVMPHTDFTCLSIVTMSLSKFLDKKIAWLKQEIDIKVNQIMTLQITTLKDQQTYYYVLKAGVPTQHKQISLEDYTEIADGWPNTVIECKSMKYFKFSLGKMMDIIINVEAAGENERIQPLGEWNLSRRDAIISSLCSIQD